MKLTIPNMDAAVKAMADEDLAHWDQQCPTKHYEALLQAAWNTICISTDDTEPSGDVGSLVKSKMFQKFLSQGFWHAHHVDLVWRYNGEDVREEADWLKDLWYFVKGKHPAPLPSDKLTGLVRKLEQMEQYHRGMWTDSGDSRYDAEYARMHEAFADELKAMLSQEPSSGATVTADVEPASLGAAETTLKAIAKASRDRIHNAGCWSADFIFEVLTDEFRKHQPIKAGDSGAEE